MNHCRAKYGNFLKFFLIEFAAALIVGPFCLPCFINKLFVDHCDLIVVNILKFIGSLSIYCGNQVYKYGLFAVDGSVPNIG